MYGDDCQAQIKLLTLLAKHGASPALQNSDGYDALYLAVLVNHMASDLRVFKAFLELFKQKLSALVIAHNGMGLYDPLPHMVFTGNNEFVKLFLSHFGEEMDLAIKNSNGESPIQLLKRAFDDDHVLLVTKALW